MADPIPRVYCKKTTYDGGSLLLLSSGQARATRGHGAVQLLQNIHFSVSFLLLMKRPGFRVYERLKP